MQIAAEIPCWGIHARLRTANAYDVGYYHEQRYEPVKKLRNTAIAINNSM